MILPYSEHADALWALTTDPQGPVEVEIVWDGLPRGWRIAPELQGFVGPLDWVVAYRLVHGGGRRLVLRVVGDLTSDDLLKLRLLGISLPADSVPPGAALCSAWVTVLGPAGVAPADPGVPAEAELEQLRGFWLALLGASGVRHAVANLVGAYILSPRENGAALALQCLFAALTGEQVSTGPVGYLVKLPKVRSALLVDDQHEIGWKRFLNTSISNLSLTPVKNPLVEVGGGPPLMQLLRDGAPVPWDLIFLDLRLYAGRPREAQHHRDAVAALPAVEDAPWPAEAAAPLPPDVSDLLRFPRALARTYPTTPIILFSATSRRQVVDGLADCANVITDFEKPRIVDGAASVRRAREGLARAIRRAEGILDVRDRLRDIAMLGVQPSIGAGAPHVGVFLDESGGAKGETFSVGGVILVSTAASVDMPYLSRALEIGGAKWSRSRTHHGPVVPDPEFEKPPGDLPQRLRPLRERALSRAQEVFGQLGVSVHPFAIVADPGWTARWPELVDAPYRALLTSALELIVADVIAPHPTGSLWIEAATRVRTGLEPRRVDHYVERFGREAHRSKRDSVYSLSLPDVHPMVEEILRRRGAHRVLAAARAARLNVDPATESRLLPLQQHHLADELLRVAWMQAEGLLQPEDIPTATRWLDQGFVLRVDRDLKPLAGLLRGLRAAGAGLAPDGAVLDPDLAAQAIVDVSDACQAEHRRATPWPLYGVLGRIGGVLHGAAQDGRVLAAAFRRATPP